MPSPARGLTQTQRVEISNRRLIEAAAALIAEKGWEATTAAEIGRRAGYSRAMVHARYGSKDAILDAFFLDDQIQRLSPDADPTSVGLEEAMGHFDRVTALYTQDHDFLRALFVATFEAVKTTSPLRGRVRRFSIAESARSTRVSGEVCTTVLSARTSTSPEPPTTSARRYSAAPTCGPSSVTDTTSAVS